MSGYCEVKVKLDPYCIDELPNGTCIQEIELIFTDDPNPDIPYWVLLEPARCTIDARRARELAAELVAAAEAAERWERAR